MYIYVKKILKYKQFPIITASLALVFLCALSFSYGSRSSRGRAFTKAPLLWAKLDGNLTDEVSTGSTFAYSHGKPATESGINIKEGDNIQYSPGSAVSAGSGIYENWNPNQGTMNVWAQPNWAGNDNTRHDIWNGDYGRIDTTDANLKAYWKFDEGSEKFVFDSSSSDNIGYFHGPALSFDGGDYVISNFQFSIFNFQSISNWINIGTLATGKPIISKWGDSQNSILIKTDDTNSDEIKVCVANSLTDNCAIYGITANADLAAGNWYYLDVVYDGTQSANADKLKVYVNGALKTVSFTGTVPAVLQNSTTNLEIGGDLALAQYIIAKIDEVRIYNRALSATEIAQRYTGIFANESGLVGFWTMDENQGQTVYDKSGNNNNGTLGANSDSRNDDPAWVNYAPAWTDEGMFGKGIVFDGSDDEAEMGDINF